MDTTLLAVVRLLKAFKSDPKHTVHNVKLKDLLAKCRELDDEGLADAKAKAKGKGDCTIA